MRTALVVAKLPSMRATPFLAAVCALALLPAPVSGQAPSSAREQLVWHWFGGCAGNDSLFLEFHVDGKLVYSATFPICHVRRADVRPEPQQHVLTFHFDAAPHRFGAQYRASEPEPITGNVWEADRRGTAVGLGVSFATPGRGLFDTPHSAPPRSPAPDVWVPGLAPIHRAR